MGKPQGNGLVEMIDDRQHDKGFFCMALVGFIRQESEETGVAIADLWDKRFEGARQGCCRYRHECSIFERTNAKREKAKAVERIQAGQMEIQW